MLFWHLCLPLTLFHPCSDDSPTILPNLGLSGAFPGWSELDLSVMFGFCPLVSGLFSLRMPSQSPSLATPLSQLCYPAPQLPIPPTCPAPGATTNPKGNFFPLNLPLLHFLSYWAVSHWASPLASRSHLSGDSALLSLLGTTSQGSSTVPVSSLHTWKSGSASRVDAHSKSRATTKRGV